MKLTKFKESNHKKLGIILFTISCLLLITVVFLYKSFALFETNENKNIINGKVQDPGDLYFAFYVNNTLQKDMPKQEEGYVLDEEKSYCGVAGQKNSNIKVFVTEDNMIHISGVTTSRTKCNLYFVKGIFLLGKGVPIVETGDGLYEVNHEDVTEINEGFKETEYRYAGSNPKNYILFNNELWRIIGLVNVMTSETNVEQRVKIIRNDSIGKYSWDLQADLSNSNSWQDASLNKLLNGSYYNSQNNIAYYNCAKYNFQLNKCDQREDQIIDFSATGIKENIKNMIEKVYWDTSITNININFQQYIIEERTGNSIQNNIGMIYPSDYFYTTSTRNNCLLNLDWKDQEDCYNNSWLSENKEESLWTISSMEYNPYSVCRLVHGEASTNVYHSMAVNASTFANHVKPVLYLKTNVKILNDEQDGSEDSPFQLVQILK